MTSHDTRAVAAPTQDRAARSAPPALLLATACPRCGAAVPSEASDFCEHCSAHLYPGHCVFCLEPFSIGQEHCRKCGLPPEGVICGACGTFSRFDFCPNPDCGAGLTPRAAAELARVESDPEILDAFAELDEISAVVAAVDSSERAGAHYGSVDVGSPDEAPTSKATPTFAQPTSEPERVKAVAPSPATRPSLAALRAAAMSATSAAEKARVRRLAEQAAQDALHAVSSRPFPTAQEARAAGTALQVALRCRVQVERLETIAWRCNRFGVEHPEPGGMSLCSDPASGGVPIMRVITEIDDRSTEFTA
jgi:hypothetical protein